MQRSKLVIWLMTLIGLFLLCMCFLNNRPRIKKDTTLVDNISYWEQKSINANNPKDRAWAYCQIAIRYSELEEFDKMMEYFSRALSIAPEDPKVLHQAAMGYLHAKKYDMTVSTMKRAKELVANSKDEKLKKLIYGDYEIVKEQCKLLKAQTATGDGRRQELLHALSQIQIGMSKDEAREIMASFIRGTNLPLWGQGGHTTIIGYKKKQYELDTTADEKGNIVLKGCDVYRHCDDCRYDFDWAIICYENNRVAWTDFAPEM